MGVTEGAVRRRVKRMIDQGILQIVGIVEPQFLEWNAAGMIGVSVQAGRVEEVGEQIAHFPEVTYLFMASGGFDLFVEVYCRNREHFVSFLNNELQQIPGVERTESFMILKMFKLSYRWGQAETP
jgi:Lrp/AsnC family transcriptional regulator for asnA, asnC and gidA